MSSSSTGPYQSRLFQFLHRQSRRVVDKGERSLRQMKVAAAWSAQILLYPVYLLVQTSRMTGHQLKQAVQEGLPQFLTGGQSQPTNPINSDPTPPPADTPIQQVLLALNAVEPEELETNSVSDSTTASGSQPKFFSVSTLVSWASFYVPWLSKVAQKTDSTPTPTEGLRSLKLPQLRVTTLPAFQLSGTTQELSGQRKAVQGIACLLTTRSLILVTNRNQILDVLTPQQQRKLQQRISWELADYWYQRRIAHMQGFKSQLKLSVEQQNLLPPVRFFWGLMAWVQTGPVAMATNLFQESSLVQSQTSADSLFMRQVAPFLLQPLVFLDRTLAQLEAQPQPPFTALINLPQTLRQKVQIQFIQPMPQSVSAQISTAEATEVNSLKIQGLIRAAIHYFFAKFNGNLPQAGTLERPSLSATSSQETPQLMGRRTPLLTSASTTLTLRTQALVQRVQTVLSHSTSPGVSTAGTAEAEPLKIHALIQAAIHYFFGKFSSIPGIGASEQPTFSMASGGTTHPLTGRLSASLLATQPPNPQLPAAEEPDPWLTMDDLFGNSAGSPATGGQRKVPDSKAATSTLPSDTAPVASASPIWKQTKRSQNSQLPKPHSAETKRRSRTPSRTQPPRTALLSSTPAVVAPTQDVSLNSPDWIETQATPIGYVKHPLEQLLEWLDSVMLWIEQLLINLWNWVRQWLP